MSIRTLSFRVLFGLSALLIAAGIQAHGQSDDAGALVIGGLAKIPIPPYIWYDECEQRYRGVAIHLVEKALRDHDYAFRYAEPLTLQELWREPQRQLLAGEIDILPFVYNPPPAGITISEQAILKHRDSWVVKRGTENQLPFTQRNGKKLRGYILDASETGAQYFVLQKLRGNGAELAFHPDSAAALQAVLNGDIDYLIGDHYFILGMAVKGGFDKQLRFYPVNLSTRYLHVGVKTGAGHEPMLAHLDQHFLDYHHTGLVERLSRSYLQQWLEMPVCSKPQLH